MVSPWLGNRLSPAEGEAAGLGQEASRKDMPYMEDRHLLIFRLNPLVR